MHPDQIETAARLLATAHTAEPVAQLPAPPEGLEDAFAIQRRTAALLGPVGAWKHGLLGGKDLACAPILVASVLPDGVKLSPRLNLRVEVETAFRLVRPISAGATPDQIFAAIGSVHVAFEILASRYADPAAHTPLEAMADRFSNHAIVLGEEIPGWRERDLVTLPIEAPFAPPGAPTRLGLSLPETIAFLSFLATRAEAMGHPLTAGQSVITGARLGPVAFDGAGRYEAKILGARVSVEVLS